METIRLLDGTVFKLERGAVIRWEGDSIYEGVLPPWWERPPSNPAQVAIWALGAFARAVWRDWYDRGRPGLR